MLRENGVKNNTEWQVNSRIPEGKGSVPYKQWLKHLGAWVLLLGLSSPRFQVYGLERGIRGSSGCWLLFLESATPLSFSPPPEVKGGVWEREWKTQKDQKGTPDPLSLKAIHASAPPPSELALRKKEPYSPGFAPSNDAEDTTAVPVSTAVPGRVMNWRQSARLNEVPWEEETTTWLYLIVVQ